MYSFHWYLAIIYHPEHILSPPPPPIPPDVAEALKPNTRKRKRNVVESPPGSRARSPDIVPDSQPASVSSSRGQSVSDIANTSSSSLGEQEEVAVLLSTCSLATEEERQSSSMSTETELTSIEDMQAEFDIPTLEYPPDDDDDEMDVEMGPSVISPSDDSSPVTVVPSSSSVIQDNPSSDTSQATQGGLIQSAIRAIAPARFYGGDASASSKEKAQLTSNADGVASAPIEIDDESAEAARSSGGENQQLRYVFHD